MAWIQRTKKKNGNVTFWIRDVRDGWPIIIDTKASSAPEAEMKLEQYLIRRDLEKEGYDDKYQDLLDQLWGPKQEILRKAKDN